MLVSDGEREHLREGTGERRAMEARDRTDG